MNSNISALSILLIDDDEESLDGLTRTLPASCCGLNLRWDPCRDFDEAISRLSFMHYDIVVTDIYVVGRGHKKAQTMDETGAGNIIKEIQRHRFCPILAVTDGSKPVEFEESVFVRFADKTTNRNIVDGLEKLIATGLPAIAQALHNELDRLAGAYLWEILQDNWDVLEKLPDTVLTRLVRRRAAVQFGRVDLSGTEATELQTVEGLEFYIYPAISGDELRLGHILRHNMSGEFRVVLTPHCHLTVQQGKTYPVADFVLTAKTVPIEQLVGKKPVKPQNKTQDQIHESIRKRIQAPVGIGTPAGRYWYFPAFLQIPELYCDLLQLESLPISQVTGEYEPVATLDTPYAESLQSCFTKLYSAVGIPNLDPAQFEHIAEIKASENH